MAGTITTDQTVVKAAEVLADYLVLGTFASARALNDDIKVEGVNAINGRVSANTAWALASTAADLNLTGGAHVFLWLRNLTWASTDTKANGGIGISISSDVTPTLTGTSPSNGPTNSKTWYLAGSNTDTTTGWACYVVDPQGTADLSLGTPDMAAVDRIGLRAKITGTVSNKTLNVHDDVIRYGTGLTIIDGTGQTPVATSDIFTQDSSNTNAWGVVTQQASTYFLAGKLKFGTTGQTAETIFTETTETFVYQNFPVASTFYEIIVVGAATEKTTFRLGSYTPATGLVSGGCSIKGAGDPASTTHAIWTLTASDANQVTRLYNSTFTELRSAALSFNTVSFTVASCTTTNASATVTTTNNFNTAGVVTGMLVTGTGIPASTYVSTVDSITQITLNKNATASGTVTLTFEHSNEIRGCTFNNFGAITTNGCLIDDCTFSNVKTTAPISATNALVIASPTEMSRVTNSNFVNCNNAIKITVAGTYTFDKLTFTGNTFDIENSSAGLVTINATNGANPVTSTNTGGGSTVINNAKTITVTVKDSNNVAIQSAQVWIQKDPSDTDYGHEAKPFTSAAGNNTGDGDFVVSETLPSDLPSSGWINVTSSGRLQSYRYASKAGSTFTLRTGVTGTDNGSGTTTTISETGITAKDIVEGDTIRMTASPKEWAIVLSNTGDVVTTTATSGGTSWASKAYSVHTLAMTYQQTTDKATVPLMNEETNASGVATESYNYGSSKNVIIRVRKASSGTKYLPYSTTGTITGDFTLAVTLTTDTIA